MSNQHSVTKRHRRPKSGKRTDYTARTMAAVKQLAQCALRDSGYWCNNLSNDCGQDLLSAASASMLSRS
jgi:hypothetical protein